MKPGAATEEVGAVAGWLRFLRHVWDVHKIAMQAGAWGKVVTCDTCGRRWEWGR